MLLVPDDTELFICFQLDEPSILIYNLFDKLFNIASPLRPSIALVGDIDDILINIRKNI